MRHVSDAFAEDPLRVLRVARFYARYAHLGFTIADETIALMQAISNTDELKHLTPERIWKELERALSEQSPHCFVEALCLSNALGTLLPEWNTLKPSTLTTIINALPDQQRSLLVFALFSADCSGTDVEQLCARLKVPNEFSQLALLYAEHGQLCSQAASDAETLYQRLEQLDAFRKQDRVAQLFTLAEAQYSPAAGIAQLKAALKTSQQINAKALAASGLKGPAVGQALRQQRIDAIEATL